MPDALVPASLLVVVLSLLASLGWGVADFGGGLTSRRAPVLGVLGGSQLAGLLIAIPLLLLIHEPAMRQLDLLISIGGGVLGALGLALLYRGLSIGRMSVVAPVAALLTALLPVGFGFLTQGFPPAPAIVGIACAMVSVILVSRVSDDGDTRPSGIGYALAAGTTFGLFTISASQLSDDLVISPTVVIRITSVAVIGAFVLLRKQAWRVPRGLWPRLLAIGIIDMSATAAYLSAIAVGPLAIASIIGSLYPVITTVLAAAVLRERVTRTHALGILAAGAAVALIAGATA
ncbi:MAG TPA: DMT family transporter [Candidatus Limnocylindria bacterium]|nr:DMT family transporter [Candidatus Limnocylindria bacterium]